MYKQCKEYISKYIINEHARIIYITTISTILKNKLNYSNNS